MPILFNPSVTTATGDDWKRHRRITALPFNEGNMKIVWQESLRQASAMTRWWDSVSVHFALEFFQASKSGPNKHGAVW